MKKLSPPEPIETTASLTVGLSGLTRHGCVALTDGREILGICEQERVTRVRAAGFNATGLPDEALNLLLSRKGKSRTAIQRYIVADDSWPAAGQFSPMNRHLAHACTSYLSSSLSSAVIVVCDQELPMVSVWMGKGSEVTPFKWPWNGRGFSDLYSSCAKLMDLGGTGDQRFEALARLQPEHRAEWLCDLLNTDGTTLYLEDGWESRVVEWLQNAGASSGLTGLAACAAALQHRIADLLLLLLAKVRKVTQEESLCLAGSLFCHTSINTAVRTSDLFQHVFIPVDPSEAGLAVGAALYECRSKPGPLSPFLGPSYTSDEVKATLDNCKVQYTTLTESEAIETAVNALQRGQLVGWYEGAMEWGQRALGARSIIANPFAPYVLENLNRFLKHREPWRGYALSALKPAVDRHFDGPSESPFMECDFRCRDLGTFGAVLPSPEAAIRIHIAGEETPRGFRRMLEAFGATCGIPCVVNTSFNTFHEPIVCSPRDAVRAFYSSGVDLLILDRFLLTK